MSAFDIFLHLPHWFEGTRNPLSLLLFTHLSSIILTPCSMSFTYSTHDRCNTKSPHPFVMNSLRLLQAVNIHICYSTHVLAAVVECISIRCFIRCVCVQPPPPKKKTSCTHAQSKIYHCCSMGLHQPSHPPMPYEHLH